MGETGIVVHGEDEHGPVVEVVPKSRRRLVCVPASALPDAATVAAVERCVAYLDASARLDVALDDDTLDAGEQFAEFIAAYQEARDAIRPDDAATLRAFVAAQEGTGDGNG